MGDIARQAGVSVQTLYTQFGSKSGLLRATIEEVSRDAGLDDSFTGVWSQPTGELMLRSMVAATVGFWHRAWPFVEFTLRARRVHPVLGDVVAELDASRRGHLVDLCSLIAAAGHLRPDFDAVRAADVAFALTTPTVYEELVVVRGWAVDMAIDNITDAVLGALLTVGPKPR